MQLFLALRRREGYPCIGRLKTVLQEYLVSPCGEPWSTGYIRARDEAHLQVCAQARRKVNIGHATILVMAHVVRVQQSTMGFMHVAMD